MSAKKVISDRYGRVGIVLLAVYIVEIYIYRKKVGKFHHVWVPGTNIIHAHKNLRLAINGIIKKPFVQYSGIKPRIKKHRSIYGG